MEPPRPRVEIIREPPLGIGGRWWCMPMRHLVETSRHATTWKRRGLLLAGLVMMGSSLVFLGLVPGLIVLGFVACFGLLGLFLLLIPAAGAREAGAGFVGLFLTVLVGIGFLGSLRVLYRSLLLLLHATGIPVPIDYMIDPYADGVDLLGAISFAAATLITFHAAGSARRLFVARQLDDLPSSKIRSAAAGMVEVVGTVEAAAPGPLHPDDEIHRPFVESDAAIVAAPDVSTGTRLMVKPFLLRDETGVVKVDPRGAFSHSAATSSLGLSQYMAEAAETIRAGDEVCVIGYAEPDPDPAAQPDGLVIRRRLSDPGRFRFLPDPTAVFYVLKGAEQNKSRELRRRFAADLLMLVVSLALASIVALDTGRRLCPDLVPGTTAAIAQRYPKLGATERVAIYWLGLDSKAYRNLGMEQLRRGPAVAIAYLDLVEESPFEDVRRRVGTELRFTEGIETIMARRKQTLLRALGSAETEVAWFATFHCRSTDLPAESVLPLLSRFVRHPNHYLREDVVAAAAHYFPAGRELAAAMLHDQYAWIAARALAALEAAGPEVLSLLVGKLDGGPEYCRKIIVEAVDRILTGRPDRGPVLLGLAHRDDPVVRLAALDRLRAGKPLPELGQAIETMLADPSDLVRDAAFAALANLDPERLAKRPRDERLARLTSANAHARSAAWKSVIGTGVDVSVWGPMLVGMGASMNPEHRTDALGWMLDPAAAAVDEYLLPALRTWFRDPHHSWYALPFARDLGERALPLADDLIALLSVPERADSVLQVIGANPWLWRDQAPRLLAWLPKAERHHAGTLANVFARMEYMPGLELAVDRLGYDDSYLFDYLRYFTRDPMLAVNWLERQVQDVDSPVIDRALKALGEIGPDVAHLAPRFRELRDSNNDRFCWQAARALFQVSQARRPDDWGGYTRRAPVATWRFNGSLPSRAGPFERDGDPAATWSIDDPRPSMVLDGRPVRYRLTTPLDLRYGYTVELTIRQGKRIGRILDTGGLRIVVYGSSTICAEFPFSSEHHRTFMQSGMSSDGWHRVTVVYDPYGPVLRMAVDRRATEMDGLDLERNFDTKPWTFDVRDVDITWKGLLLGAERHARPAWDGAYQDVEPGAPFAWIEELRIYDYPRSEEQILAAPGK